MTGDGRSRPITLPGEAGQVAAVGCGPPVSRPGRAGPYGDAELNLGVLLRRWRERALLTQEQLAERARLNVRTVRRLEANGLRQARTTSLLLLAEALGLDTEERETLVDAARGLSSLGGYEDPAGVGATGAAPTPIVPRQLPADVAAFVGRERELTALDGHQSANTVTVDAIDGMAGSGKTVLAVHAAHRLASRFPDGQLFLDLHGHTPDAAPVQPGAALARVIRALGVPEAHVPGHIEDGSALLRSVLADRRVLIVLDNAADEDQGRPLLPASPGGRVIVTRRRRLVRLDHTRTLSLDVLPVREAVALFVRMAGQDRVADTPADVLRRTVERCGLLPLAVGLAAARLRSHPAWSVGHLLERLDDRDRRPAGPPAGRSGVAAALDLSYQRLSEDQRRAYRVLGSRGGEFRPDEAAALLDMTPEQAGRLLDQLLRVHLLQEHTPGLYRFHELVSDHARLTL
ncbi:NB-ARC domain-containing protein [Actinomadura sp. 9N215]|uniref:NB-ARC domain-containing protein n=1 Tax=Actinomadura sp. 9N215 TaxID=3375150 RepID=UPI0037AE62A9